MAVAMVAAVATAVATVVARGEKADNK